MVKSGNASVNFCKSPGVACHQKCKVTGVALELFLPEKANVPPRNGWGACGINHMRK